jgi:SAM-dependent methyltransferase
MSRCPGCQAADTVNLGRIPAADNFAGRRLARAIPGGSLYRCRRCRLGYRYPRLALWEADELYRQGAESAWSPEFAGRTDWRLARERILARFGAGFAVLDVGCFDGGFLGGLTRGRRCGIEINAQAAARARARGVDIIGAQWDDPDVDSAAFDVVTAFDLIEHLPDPAAFLRTCAARLRPGGLLFISTGNLDAWSWRMAGARYWYCTIPEHISFLCPHWFGVSASPACLAAKQMIAFSHDDAPLAVRLKETAAGLLYSGAPDVFAWLRQRGVGRLDVAARPEVGDTPPRWQSARDHVLAVFEKTGP